MAFGFGIGKNKVLVYSVDEFSTQVNGIVDPKLALKQDKQVTRKKYLAHTDWSASYNSDGYLEQTVNIEGVTADNTVFVSSEPETMRQYNESGVFAYSQGNGTLTFYCTSRPSLFLGVNIVILGV